MDITSFYKQEMARLKECLKRAPGLADYFVLVYENPEEDRFEIKIGPKMGALLGDLEKAADSLLPLHGSLECVYCWSTIGEELPDEIEIKTYTRLSEEEKKESTKLIESMEALEPYMPASWKIRELNKVMRDMIR